MPTMQAKRTPLFAPLSRENTPRAHSREDSGADGRAAGLEADISLLRENARENTLDIDQGGLEASVKQIHIKNQWLEAKTHSFDEEFVKMKLKLKQVVQHSISESATIHEMAQKITELREGQKELHRRLESLRVAPQRSPLPTEVSTSDTEVDIDGIGFPWHAVPAEGTAGSSTSKFPPLSPIATPALAGNTSANPLSTCLGGATGVLDCDRAGRVWQENSLTAHCRGTPIGYGGTDIAPKAREATSHGLHRAHVVYRSGHLLALPTLAEEDDEEPRLGRRDPPAKAWEMLQHQTSAQPAVGRIPTSAVGGGVGLAESPECEADEGSSPSRLALDIDRFNEWDGGDDPAVPDMDLGAWEADLDELSAQAQMRGCRQQRRPRGARAAGQAPRKSIMRQPPPAVVEVKSALALWEQQAIRHSKLEGASTDVHGRLSEFEKRLQALHDEFLHQSADHDGNRSQIDIRVVDLSEKVQHVEGRVGDMSQKLDELLDQSADQDGTRCQIEVSIDDLLRRVEHGEGRVGEISQKIDEFLDQPAYHDGNRCQIDCRVDDLSQRVEHGEGRVGEMSQKVEDILHSVQLLKNAYAEQPRKVEDILHSVQLLKEASVEQGAPGPLTECLAQLMEQQAHDSKYVELGRLHDSIEHHTQRQDRFEERLASGHSLHAQSAERLAVAQELTKRIKYELAEVEIRSPRH